MSELKDRVSKEIILAMKAKDKPRLNVLRYLKKLFIENETAKKTIDEQDIVISHAKKTKDSLEHYPEGPNRDQILAELVIMEDYLPQALSKEEVQAMIDTIKTELEKPNMGMIMKGLSSQIKGRFDGKLATDMVKASLS